MKIILQKPVEKLGLPGDVVEVADGYARNYLVPRGLAVKAHKGAAKQVEVLKRSHETRLSKQRVEYEAIASALVTAGPITVTARAGEEGKLFGSVTPQDIADFLATHGITMDRKRITLGEFSVSMRLHHDVTAQLKVNVVRE